MKAELKLQKGIEHYQACGASVEAARNNLDHAIRARSAACDELARLIKGSGHNAVVFGGQRFSVGDGRALLIEEFTDLVLPGVTKETS